MIKDTPDIGQPIILYTKEVVFIDMTSIWASPFSALSTSLPYGGHSPAFKA